MGNRDKQPGAAEMEVLRVLWEAGPCTVRDVLEHMHSQGRRVAYTTVQTLLIRLEQKGHVQANKSDLAHIFKAKLSRDRVRKSRLQSLVKDFYDGTPASLALHLISSQKFSADQISELHRLIDDLDKGPDLNP